jgi:hypothetical protein
MASILDTPSSADGTTHSFSVSTGTNRALIVGVQTEGTQSGTITCTYGGQSMTNVAQEIAASGSTQQTVAIFFLNDAGIEAASGTTITAGNVGSVDTTVHAASYEDCVQTTPTNYDTDTANASTPNPLAALDITTTSDNSVVVAFSGMGNAGTAEWNSPLTERTDEQSSSSTGSLADDEVASGSTVVACECTWTTQNRAAAVALELVHQAATNYQLEGVTYNVTGSVLGSCELFLFKDNQDNTITFVDYTTSNASTGAYLFEYISDNDAQYLIRASKDDSPHVFDATDHVCQPSETPSVSYDLYLRSDSDKGETSPDNDLRLRSDTEKLTTDPLITNADDEDFLDNETSINVVGINFGASQTGSADIEIGDNATYGSCVDIESQTVNSWGDTQINIDINFGSSTLEYGSNWLYVTESGGTTSSSYAINLYKTNTISGVSPSSFLNGTTGITVSGSDFGSSQGSSVLYLADQSDGGGTNVTQTITDWNSTSIEFTCVQGALSAGTVYVIVARNNSGLGDSGARFSNGYSTTLYETPTVTNMDDEDLLGNETNVIITGTNFSDSQGSGYVEIGNNSSYGSCTVKSTQSIDSWSDTQIQVDIVLGSLSYGGNWCFVTNGGAARNDPGYSINLYKANTITNISPSNIRNGDTGIVISGSDFGSSQGSSVLYLADQSDGGGTNVTQTITDWGSTSIEFTCVQGALTSGIVYAIVSRNNSGLGDSGARFSNGYSATLLPPPAWAMSSSGYVSNDTTTTQQLSSPSSGAWSSGKLYTTQNPGDAKSMPADAFTEYEFCVQASSESEAGAQYEFRLGGAHYFSVTPKVTLSS